MRIVATSDFHGQLPAEMPSGDILLYAGDFSPTYSHRLNVQRGFAVMEWAHWIESQGYPHIVGIAGNHDFIAEQEPSLPRQLPWTYLCDESVEIDGLLIHGAPWSSRFLDWAFMADDDELAERWALIPDETDILVVHGPPYGIGDRVKLRPGESRDPHVGSRTLLNRVGELKQLQLVVFGHIHEGYGQGEIRPGLRWANVSLLDERYQPVHDPMVFEVESRSRELAKNA